MAQGPRHDPRTRAACALLRAHLQPRRLRRDAGDALDRLQHLLCREFETSSIYLFPSAEAGSSVMYPPSFKEATPLAPSAHFVFPDTGLVALVALCEATAMSSVLRSRSSGEASSP